MQRLALMLAVLATCLGLSASGQETAKIQPLVGQFRKIKVQRGDTLTRIARRENVNRDTLARLNHLSTQRPKPGRTLVLPSLHIAPRNPKDALVLNIPERRVYVFKAGVLLAHYPVAVGKPDWQTVTGTFNLASKEINPKWKPTQEMVQRGGIKDDLVPPGADNPLGDRWMGWSKPGYGFHSTIVPQSIGMAASHGCVRLYPDAARRLFDQVQKGMTIYSVYEPLQIGERGGKFYLTVFPDIYKKNLVSIARAEKRLAKVGLLPLVDTNRLRQIVKRQDGVPRLIVGEDTRLQVNGQDIKATIAPVRLAGHWVVAVKELVAALGGEVAPAQNGGIKISHQGRLLVLAARRKENTAAFRPNRRRGNLDGSAVSVALVIRRSPPQKKPRCAVHSDADDPRSQRLSTLLEETAPRADAQRGP